MDSRLIHENINEHVDLFVKQEIINIRSVSSRMGLAEAAFIAENFPGATYSFVTVNGDLSKRFLEDNMDQRVFKSLNNRHLDSFIRNVDEKMNRYFYEVLLRAEAA